MDIFLLNVGDELLIGQVVNTNAAWMAQELNAHGAHVVGTAVVADQVDAIRKGIGEGLEKADAVLMTGGLGPTKDDVTKKALADYFEQGFVFSQETFVHIQRFFEKLGRPITDAHRQQCFMPQNAELLPNKMGTAPGMWMEEGSKVVISMPGIPYEMKHIMEKQVLPRLRDHFPGKPIVHRTILTVGEGESRIAQRIKELEDNLPENIKLSYLPRLGQVRLRLTATGADEKALHLLLDQEMDSLRQLIPDLIFGYEQETLEAKVGQLLREAGLSLVTAESCTGGYVAHLLTSVPGSSDYFLGSIIAYSNEVKKSQLGVQAKTLQQYGAVSKQTVHQMVVGATDLLQADVAVATSGIAGPGGGTPEKPVGTVWVAVGNRQQVVTQKIQLGKDRLKNIQFSAIIALNLLRQFVLNKENRSTPTDA